MIGEIPMEGKTTNDQTSLWECLHDGDLKAIELDALSRVAMLSWDVPYLWTFHALPIESRFEFNLEEVREAQVLEFQPWPGATRLPVGPPWSEQEVIRRTYYEKAVYTSWDWHTFVQSVSTSDYECSNAHLTRDSKGKVRLSLDLSNSAANEYPTVCFAFTNMRVTLTPDRELTMEQFLAMGAAYWNDFAERSSILRDNAESSKG